MNEVLSGYGVVVEVVKRALFWLAVATAIIALVDWLVRTRRVNPFGRIARFSRRFFDPLMRPVEVRLVRAGKLPTNAPWWTLGVVIVGGLLLIALLDLLRGVLGNVFWGFSSPARFVVLIVGLLFFVLRAAIIVRVISSWIRVSPYSRWIHWSFTLSEWMLAPLRRIIPNIGMIDITPIIAWFLLILLERGVGALLAGVLLTSGRA